MTESDELDPQDEPESIGVPFMTRGAAYAAMLIGAIALGSAAFNVYLWNDNRTTKAELVAERAARLSQREQDERGAKITQVTQCRQAIPAIARANAVIRDLRSDHQDRARQARALAKADPTPVLRHLHLQIAAQQDQKARDLEDFTPVTTAECNALAKKLLGPRWRKIVPSTISAGGS